MNALDGRIDCNGPPPRGMQYPLMTRERGYTAGCSRQLALRGNPVVLVLLTYSLPPLLQQTIYLSTPAIPTIFAH